MTNPILSRINIYPIKSLDAVSVDSAECLNNGALGWDRRFAMRTADGQVLTGKQTAAVHRLQADFQLDAGMVQLGDRASEKRIEFSLLHDLTSLNQFLSVFFGQSVTLVENLVGGFPDDCEAAGPTLISEGTLQAVAEWFGKSVAEIRCRFRTNLEISGVAPFWEDRMFAAAGGIGFKIGETNLIGTNPCQRCVVPTRSADTGDVTAGFVKDFCRQRERTLPDWAPANRFDHYYRLAVNTVGQGIAGRVLCVGDRIRLHDGEID